MRRHYSIRNDSGFMATTAVIVLGMGTLALFIGTFVRAISLGESVSKKEMRIQAGLNISACLDFLSVMAAKDAFLSGPVTLGDFGCRADVTNGGDGRFEFRAVSELEGVRSEGRRSVDIDFSAP